ncbi:hypothetical protein C8Q72DRAFT_400938 [Fomitopsis betulina]|nr:hypothetical protein C8Q72DRAFT_400938 [Fomitopsis betulina]
MTFRLTFCSSVFATCSATPARPSSCGLCNQTHGPPIGDIVHGEDTILSIPLRSALPQCVHTGVKSCRTCVSFDRASSSRRQEPHSSIPRPSILCLVGDACARHLCLQTVRPVGARSFRMRVICELLIKRIRVLCVDCVHSISLPCSRFDIYGQADILRTLMLESVIDDMVVDTDSATPLRNLGHARASAALNQGCPFPRVLCSQAVATNRARVYHHPRLRHAQHRVTRCRPCRVDQSR